MTAEIRTETVSSFDGAALAVHSIGEGRPVLLLHGLFSEAQTNWIKFGHAEAMAAQGYRVIMPDFRAHGQSAAPTDASAYPSDVLVRDTEHLISHFGLDDFDIGGFSLGARTTARLLGKGLKPGKAILSGMGLEGLSGWGKRRTFFADALAAYETSKRGDPHWMAIQFMKTQKVDRVAMAHLLDSIPEAAIDDFSTIQTPVLVLCGRDDRDNGSPEALTEKLPNGTLEWIEGTHMSCVTKPELGTAMARFLAA